MDEHFADLFAHYESLRGTHPLQQQRSASGTAEVRFAQTPEFALARSSALRLP
jgi:hypothetical protein